MNIDLDSLSLKELKDLQSRVARAISGFESRKKREALAAVAETARSLGFELDELVAGGRGLKRTVSPKYANPADRGQTWTGRGRRPRWVEAAFAAGKSLDDLAI